MGTHNWQFGRDPSSRQSALGHARGTGAGGDPAHHWLMHRLTAVALVPLTPWFLYSLFSGVAADYASMQMWLGKPGNMTLMILFIICCLWHGQLAYAVVVHDYVHTHWREFTVQTLVKFGCFTVGVFGIICVLKIGLGG